MTDRRDPPPSAAAPPGQSAGSSGPKRRRRSGAARRRARRARGEATAAPGNGPGPGNAAPAKAARRRQTEPQPQSPPKPAPPRHVSQLDPPRNTTDHGGEAPPQQDAHSRWWLLAGLGVLLLGIAAGVALYLLRPRPEPQQPGPQAPFVQTAPAEARMTPLIITGNGVVQPRAEIGLSTQVAGRVADMHPNLLSGGAFDAGEALIRLEDEDYVNAVRQARAAVAQRQVELQQAREEVRIAEQELENLRQRLDGLGSDPAGHAQVGPGQDSGLAADFDVPGQTAAGGRAADTADPPPDGGAPAPREDGAGGLAVSPLTLRRPQLEAAEAALAAARAQLADAELALARTTVTAPFAGQVRSENVDVGQFVQPGQELARIYSSDAVEVVVPLTSDEAALIPALWSLPAGGGGTSVDAEVSAEFGGRRFAWRGYVDRAKGFIDPQSRTVDVVVRVPEPFRTDPPAAEDAPAQRPPLLIGTYTTVRIQGQQPGRYLAIPASALHDGDRVWILSPMETDGDERMRLEVRPVTVILRDDQRVFVTAPEIADGTLLVTTDLAAVTDGMAVRTRATPAETP